jgi:chromosome partitioning protein
MDPQGNATSGLGVTVAEGIGTIYDVLLRNADVTRVIRRTDHERLVVIPSDVALAGAEIELVKIEEREFLLKKKLRELQELYDFVFIDCPPSLGLLTINALCVADSVLVPVQSEYYALEGLGKLMQTISMVRDRLNPSLRLEGAVLTMFDRRTNLAVEVQAEVEKFFGDTLFRTVIPRNVRLSEAPSFGQSIFAYDTTSAGAVAYRELGREFLQRQRSEPRQQIRPGKIDSIG